MSDATTTAGWFPDPHGRFEFRYWDGAGWTDHVSRSGAADRDGGSADPGASATKVEGAVVEGAVIEGGVLARRRAAKQTAQQGRNAFEALALHAALGNRQALAQLSAAVDEARHHYKERDFRAARLLAAQRAAYAALGDDILEADEEEHIAHMLDRLGLTFEDLRASDADLWTDLVVARINAGRLPIESNPLAVLRRDEVAHGAFAVTLMKEVAVRQWQGGSSGVSVPIGFGMRYRTSTSRGRSVVVGSQLIVASTGTLTVTSTRTLFTGSTKTLEFRHDKLVGMEEFTDGLRLNVSNRQTASLFIFTSGSVPSIAAAMISYCTAQA